MDRHHSRHRKARVELPLSIRSARLATLIRRTRINPLAKSVMGLMGFVTGGAAVVVTASLLALQLT